MVRSGQDKGRKARKVAPVGASANVDPLVKFWDRPPDMIHAELSDPRRMLRQPPARGRASISLTPELEALLRARGSAEETSPQDDVDDDCSDPGQHCRELALHGCRNSGEIATTRSLDIGTALH